MKKNKKDLVIGVIAVVLLLVFGGIFIYSLWQAMLAAGNLSVALFQTISTLDTVIVIALISGAVTIFGLVVNSIISIILKTSEHKNKIRAEMRAKMEPVYAKFVSMIFDILFEVKKNKSANQDKLEQKMVEFSKEIILYGSNNVLKKWVTVKTSRNLPPVEMMKQLEKILFTIREDLGIKRKRMKTGDILSLFINDIQEVLNKK